MTEIFKNVRQEIIKLIPSSVMKDLACFVFYDNYPRDEKTIDITICTKSGELKEFRLRDLVSALELSCVSTPTHIGILRNGQSELFYVVTAGDDLFIISSKDQLKIYKKITNVDKYDIDDFTCSGISCLKVTRKDDAVPLRFDINFEISEDPSIVLGSENDDDSLPIVTELKRKLVEARYTTKCNEKTFSEYLNLRQKVSLQSHEKLHPNLEDSTLKDNLKIVPGSLKLKTIKPWIKVCNKKLIILLDVLNHYKEALENIHILLNTKFRPSLVYTTKIFTKQQSAPYFEEIEKLKLQPKQEYAIVAVMKLEEIKKNVTSRIELSGCVSYTLCGKEYLLPFEDVEISSLESMGDEFDVLSNMNMDIHTTFLAILASTVKTELILRHIKDKDEPDVSLLDLFCTHLQMERLGDGDNVIVYRKYPYHILNGTMISFGNISQNSVSVSVHTSYQSQVLALLHYMYDAIPAKIVATAPTYKISAKSGALSHYNEEMTNTHKKVNRIGYATSILNNSSKILDYLDDSMIKMSESKNSEVVNKVGTYIDLFAGGVDNFKEFRREILEEARKGINSLSYYANKSEVNTIDSDMMIVD